MNLSTMQITPKNTAFLMLYTASLLGAGAWFSSFYTSEEKNAEISESDKKPPVVESKKTPTTIKPKEIKQPIAWFWKNKKSEPTRESPAEFLEAYTVGENIDYESWEFQKNLQDLALTDWEAASQYIDGIPSETTKLSILQKILPRLADKNPELAINIANQTANKTARNKILGEICDRIAPNRPQYVADLFIQNGYKRIGNYEIRNFVADYAREDLIGAREFVDNIEDPVIWKTAMTQYLYKWSDKEPQKAADFAISHKASLHGASSMLGQLQAKKDPTSTVEYGKSMPVNENSIEFLDGAYMRWAYDDVHSAAESILDIPTERLRMSSFKQIAWKFAEVDTQKGIEWINKLPSEEHKKGATYRFVETWVYNDPSSAVEYVNDLPEGTVKDSAIYPLVNRFQEVEPAYALEWTQAISASGGRDKWVKYSYEQWKKQDAQAAAQWLSSTTTLTDDTKQMLSK